jgi:hypothetical protein
MEPQEQPLESNSSAQARRAKAGRDFENKVFDDLVKSFGVDSKIQLLRPRTQVYPPGSKRKHEFSCLQIVTAVGEIIGDSDIVAYHIKRQTPIALISCKTSVRERMMQSIGNREMYRKAGFNPILFFVTNDKELEFGTANKPNKCRVVAQYMDVLVYSTNPLTDFSAKVIYPYEQMITDLKRISGMQP